MKKLLLLLILILFCIPAHAQTTHNAANCTQATLNTLINGAMSPVVNGDTVQLPTCDETWTGLLTISKAITLHGNGCTLDGNSRPTACNTIIKDGRSADAPILTFNLVADQYSRMTEIDFENDAGGAKTHGIVTINGSSQDARRARFDTNIFNGLNGSNVFTFNTLGVIDHNTFIGASIFVYIWHEAWGGFTFADGSWSEPVNFGSEEFLFLEDNTFNHSANVYAITDAYRGARYVARHNDVTNGWFEMHGTDSAQRRRGTRAIEVYNNAYACTIFCTYAVNSRSGTSIVFDNTFTSYSSPGPSVAVLADRLEFPFSPFDDANGRNPWDVNIAGGPFESGTATAGSGSLSLTDSSKSWMSSQWIGYSLIQTSGCAHPPYCASIIIASTATTLTLESDNGFAANNGWPSLTIAAGDTYEIWKVNAVLDQPGVGFGTQLLAKTISNITASGTTVTVTVNNHGWSTGDYVGLAENDCFPTDTTCRLYNGTHQITVTGTNTFTFTALGSITTSPATFKGNATVVPAGWATGGNDQTLDPSYAWNNTQGGTQKTVIQSRYANQVRDNEHFYNYTASFTGATGVGRGVRASRPATCTAGVAYWSTDFDALDKCTATDTWTDDSYTAYVYPWCDGNAGILGCAGDVDPPTPPTPSTITPTDITAGGMTLSWTASTDATSPQSSLLYLPYVSTSNNITTVADAEMNGTAIGSYTTNMLSIVVTGQPSNTDLWWNVLVKDLSGNKAAYTSLNQATIACTRVGFTTQPAGGVLGSTIGTVRVSLLDANGGVCSGDSNTVTISKNASATWGTLTTTTNLAKATTNGVAEWASPDLKVTTTTGTGKLDAAAPGLTGASSANFTMTSMASSLPLGIGRLRGRR